MSGRHISGVLQPVPRPTWLQSTPILIELYAGLVLFVREQRGVRELCTIVCHRP